MAESGQVARTRGAGVVGVVACVPPKIVENQFFVDRFGDKVADVVKMTGVQTRHWVEHGTTTSDLCRRAADVLLDKLEWERASVDALIFVSQTPDYRLPATACILQDRLGLRKGIIAFDVPLGCSGYPYGLWLAMMMVQSGAAKRVLLAVGDTSSIMNDPDDRGTAILFGDAAAVTAIEACMDSAEATFILGTDGAGAQNLIVPKGAFRTCGAESKFADFAPDTLFMDGGEIFNFTLKAVPKLISETLAEAGHSVEAHDGFVLHQANAFIIRHLAKKAKLPPEKVPINIDRFGNTSSATIPLVLATDLAHSLRGSRQRLGMFGFGVGYSWASVSLEVGPLACAEIVTL